MTDNKCDIRYILFVIAPADTIVDPDTSWVCRMLTRISSFVFIFLVLLGIVKYNFIVNNCVLYITNDNKDMYSPLDVAISVNGITIPWDMVVSDRQLYVANWNYSVNRHTLWQQIITSMMTVIKTSINNNDKQ